MTKLIKVKFQIEGLHTWPEAKTRHPDVAFLFHPHRHIFFFEVKKEVSHNERDIEIIKFKRELIDYYQRSFFDRDLNLCNFGPRSCETIAQDLLENYDCTSVEVLEDNENGAICIK